MTNFVKIICPSIAMINNFKITKYIMNINKKMKSKEKKGKIEIKEKRI
jgi:hypothetical protein